MDKFVWCDARVEEFMKYHAAHSSRYSLSSNLCEFKRRIRENYENSKDYEILSFWIPEYKEIIDLKCATFGKDFYLNNTQYEIFSVKRTYDDIVFTVGDITTIGVIERFGIEGWTLQVKHDVDTGRNSWHINNIQKRKTQPLFKTEDGVGIFENDMLYYVLKDFQLHSNPANIYDGTNPDYKYFSTREAAKEYIAWNKPHFSAKEVVDRFFTNNPSDIYNYSKSKL